jgi:cytochrome o ubiquinol oxidase subunit 2
MLFDVHVVSEPDFARFTMDAVKSDRALDGESYRADLLKQSVPKDKAIYRLDDPELFGEIATQKIPPGPGPRPEPKEVSDVR